MSYARRRAEELSTDKPKKYRVVVLMWEVDPELSTHKGVLVSGFTSIKTLRRLDRDFNEYNNAFFIFKELRDRLKEYWQSIVLQR